MSGIHRWKKKVSLNPRRANYQNLLPPQPDLHPLHPSHHRCRDPLGLHLQERHKCYGGSDEFHIRRIRAESNCPRCSKHFQIPFSNSTDSSGYRALNLCSNCKTAYYFRPQKLVPLQGTFVEIGRVEGKDPEKEGENNKIGVLFWEAIKSNYSGEPLENLPPIFYI